MRLSFREKAGVLVVLALVTLGLRYFWLSPSLMGQLILYWAYWLLLAVSTAFIWSLYKEAGVECQAATRWIRRQGWMLLVPACLWILLLVHERFLFKINYDEHVLVSISRSMHLEHISGWQGDGRIYWGTMTGISFVADKRPVFYPFLLSIVHAFAGYRPSNAFVLNALLAGVAMLGAYRLGWVIGRRIGGVLLAALLAGVPLLAQNATGGGFDLLNATLIICLAVGVWSYFERPRNEMLVIICFIAIFLANTRYESILYAVVPYLCVGILWLRNRACVDLPWVMVILPLALLPAMLSNGVFSSMEVFFQMARDEFWNFKNYGGNLAHAVAYLFDPDRGGTNSILLASIGVVSAILMPLVIRRRYIERKALGPSALTLMVVGLIVLLNVVIMLGLGWGQWDDPLVSRFTLPFWFLLAWATTYVVFESTGSARIKIARFVCVLSLLYVVVFAIADASASRATNKLKPAFLLARSLEYIKQYDPWRQTLIIAGSALPYLNEGYPATTFSKKADLAPVVNFKLYENILVVLHYKRNASNGAWMGDITMKQFEGAVFETLKEFQLDPFNRIVISRLKSMPREKMAEWIPSTEDEDPASYGRRIYMMLP